MKLPAGKVLSMEWDFRMLTILEELRNQVYSDVFDDGKIANLKLLQVCKQINEEASAMGFLNTTFEMSITIPDITIRAKRLSSEQKASIKSISVDIAKSHSLHVLSAMDRSSILPREVILLANAERHSFLVDAVRKCNACLEFVVTYLAFYNPKVRKIIIRSCVTQWNMWLVWTMDPDKQFQQMHNYLSREWVGRNKNIHDLSLKEKGRDKSGITAVEISFRVQGEAAARTFTIQWDIVAV